MISVRRANLESSLDIVKRWHVYNIIFEVNPDFNHQGK